MKNTGTLSWYAIIHGVTAFVAPQPDVTQQTDGVNPTLEYPMAEYPAGDSPWVYMTFIFCPNESFRCIAKPPVTEKHWLIPCSRRYSVINSATFIKEKVVFIFK
jgi:hypothetical protein